MPAIAGVDFGTSNSTVGLYRRGQSVGMVRLEKGYASLPSCLFFEAGSGHDGRAPHFGRAAQDLFREGHSGRLLRSLKSILGTGLAHESTLIGFRHFRLEDVLVIFLEHLRNRAEAQAEEPVESAVIGRPVFFVDDNPAADRLAETQLRDVATRAGFRNVLFQYEPIAAALTYEQTLRQEELVLVADLGGGTADFSVARLSPERHRILDRKDDILGNAGIHIGGTDLDRVLSFTELMPFLGRHTTYKAKDVLMPNAPYLTLSTWHLINLLYTQRSLAEVRAMVREAAEPERVALLLEVIEKRNGHLLMEKVEAAKIALTHDEQVATDFRALLTDLQVTFTQTSFVRAIADLVARVGKTVATLLQDIGKPADAIQTVFFTGGTSAVPALRDVILAQLPAVRIVDGDPVAAVGQGLAIDAGRRF